MPALISELLPDAVACADAFDDAPGAALFPSERAAIEGAVERRRREFTTGRTCARTALVRLGVAPAAIVRGPGGAPGWPDGIVGSITHCDGYRAAAVARADHVLTLGMDAEPNEPLPDGVLELVAFPEERAKLARLGAKQPDVAWDRLLFSAKESVYKAWFPLTRQWLGFEHATVEFDLASGVFSACVRAGGAVPGFTGRWLIRDGLLLTAIAVAR